MLLYLRSVLFVAVRYIRIFQSISFMIGNIEFFTFHAKRFLFQPQFAKAIIGNCTLQEFYHWVF